MKKNAVLRLTLLFLVCLTLFACRKDIEYFMKDRDQTPSIQLEMAKVWRLHHLDKRSPGNSQGILNPKWDYAWNVKMSSVEYIVVPAPEKSVNNRDFAIRRFFLFEKKGTTITDGKIIEFIGDHYDVEKNLDYLLKSCDKNTVNGFNGIIAKYDINYISLTTIAYKNGKPTKENVKVMNGSVNDFLNSTKTSSSAMRSSCAPVEVVRNGFPATMCEGGLVSWNEATVVDPETNCVTTLIVTFTGITCPASQGSGSGSGSAGSGNPPPYGGGNNTGGGTSPYFDCFGQLNGTAVMTDCGCIPLGVTPCSANPCDEKSKISGFLNMNSHKNANNEIRLSMAASAVPNEWGAEIRLRSESAIFSSSNSVREGTSSSSFVPNFSWNSTDGYIIGATHGHPGGMAPSPSDVRWMFSQLSHSDLVAADESSKNRYKNMVSITTVTATDTYIMTVKDWAQLATLYGSHANNAAANLAYLNAAGVYLDNHGSATTAQASEYALLSMYGSAINLYKVPTSGPNAGNTLPMNLNSSSAGYGINPCL